MTMAGVKDSAEVVVRARDLPVHCPNPTMPQMSPSQWRHTPRVLLDVAATGTASCPYCGTRYRLEGPAPKGH